MTAFQLYYKYGICPFLKVIKHFEDLEEFEICFILLEVVKEMNKCGNNFPTKWSDDVLENHIAEVSKRAPKYREGYPSRFEEYVVNLIKEIKENKVTLILNYNL